MGAPSSAGLRLPAEWGPHERTLIAWPQREQAWRGTGIEAARDSTAAVVDAISRFEPVVVVVDPTQLADALKRLPEDNVQVLSAPIDDSWLRDTGPIIVTGNDGRRVGVDFGFNAWGGSFSPHDNDATIARRILEVLGIERHAEPMILEGGSIVADGEGLLVTTEQCLLDPSRNPTMSKEDIEAVLIRSLGVERIVWLDRGLLEDADTDGHVDGICVFTEPGRVLLQVEPDESDPNWANSRENAERLAAAGIETIEWDLLTRVERDSGESVVVSYLNFYFAEGALIVPVSGVDPEMDREALRRFGELFPDREIVGIDGRVLALGGGGIHCITQPVPRVAG